MGRPRFFWRREVPRQLALAKNAKDKLRSRQARTKAAGHELVGSRGGRRISFWERFVPCLSWLGCDEKLYGLGRRCGSI